MSLLFAQGSVRSELALLSHHRQPLERGGNRNAFWLIARLPFRSARIQAGGSRIRCEAPRPGAEAVLVRGERTLVLHVSARSRRVVGDCCGANGPLPRREGSRKRRTSCSPRAA